VVIAIENVRLFRQLQERTQELSRSVDQLTALGEVGRAVTSTLDLETALTTIVSRPWSCRASTWRADLGRELGGGWLDVHVHDPLGP
jgi:hypothetical protein